MEIKGIQGQINPTLKRLPLTKFKDTGYSYSLSGEGCQPLRFRKSLIERVKDLFKRTPLFFN